MNETRETGYLRRWLGERGFGFITPDDVSRGRSVFVHASALVAGDPVEGCEVIFARRDGPKGPFAVDVRVLSEHGRDT